jgi:hypothetical protein
VIESNAADHASPVIKRTILSLTKAMVCHKDLEADIELQATGLD